ncbi:melanin-concentrating hormone receptor 2 [Latimeria chalumnae]|uniref:melanin-concentrating hormone receptor 2 n=1 Tax=Latimeria chalumnae TaxID=7897 RepID=UPI00313C3F4C
MTSYDCTTPWMSMDISPSTSVVTGKPHAELLRQGAMGDGTHKSFYRYLALVHPFHLTTLRTRSKIIQVNVCLWAASCIFVLPVWIYSKVIRFKDGLESCAIDITSANDVLWYTLYLTITSFFLPLPLILVFYILILCYAWEIHQKNKKASRYNAAILRDRMRRLTKIVLVFIGVSMVSVAPYHVIQLVSLQISHPTVTYYVCYYISICLSYFSSSINPFLYIFLSGSFRKRLTGCTMINVLMAEREINNVFFVFFSGHPLTRVGSSLSLRCSVWHFGAPTGAPSWEVGAWDPPSLAALFPPIFLSFPLLLGWLLQHAVLRQGGQACDWFSWPLAGATP